MSDQNDPGEQGKDSDNGSQDSASSINAINAKERTATENEKITCNYKDDSPKFFRIAIDRWIELAFTAVIMGATIVNVLVAGWQWRTANGQLAVMQADQRPWLSLISPQITNVAFTPNAGTELKFEALVQNTGHLPAATVVVDTRIYIPWSGAIQDPPGRFLDKMCPTDPTPWPPLTGGTPVGLGGTTRGFVVFPGDKIPYEHIERIQPSIIDEMKTKNPNPAAYPYVVSCINYTFVLKSDRHQTGHIFWVYSLGPNGGREGVPLTGDTLPKEKIGVSQIQGTRAN
jgi:hypothetical protein